MIDTPEQVAQAIEQMGRMQRILESYRNEILNRNPRNFAVLAEGPLEQIRQLQAQIDDYLQRLQALLFELTRIEGPGVRFRRGVGWFWPGSRAEWWGS